MTPDRPGSLPGGSPPGGWDALARHLAGESAPDEAERIRAWLEAHPADAALVESLDRQLDRLAAHSAAPIDVEQALRVVNARREGASVLPLRGGAARTGDRVLPPDGRFGTPRRASAMQSAARWRTPMLRAAAVVVVVAGTALAIRAAREGTVAKTPALAAAVLATAAGERDSLRLLDGTLVVLGPESRLEVASGYGGERRDVVLHGDGYFEVQHDDVRPFTVRAGGAEVRDIGTAFTVRAREDAPVHVTVTQGAVLLRAANRSETEGVVLHEGDRGTLAPGGSPQVARGMASEQDLAWRNGRLVFREATLDEVREEFRRWYGLELTFAEPSLASRRFTGDFAGASADRALEVLRIALGVRLERRGDTVIVHTGTGGGAR